VSELDVKRFRGGLVFKAHVLLHHSTLGLRVIKKKKKMSGFMLHLTVFHASPEIVSLEALCVCEMECPQLFEPCVRGSGFGFRVWG